MISRNFKKIFVACVVVCSCLDAAPKVLTKADVRSSFEEMLNYHVEYKQLSSTLVKRSTKLFIEQFDPYKMYLMQDEVEAFVDRKEGEVEQAITRYYADDLSLFQQMNQTIQTSIVRAQKMRSELENAIIDGKEEVGPVSADSYNRYAGSQSELKNRIKLQLMSLLNAEGKAENITEWTTDKKRKVFALWERRFARIENTYLLKQQPQLEEHYLVMHVLKALAKSLDAHTSFFSPEEAYEMRASLEKQFEGIGVVLREGIEGIVIINLIRGGPAEKSGKIAEGDLLVEINRKKTEGMTYEQVLDSLKGDGGRKIVLGIKKPGESQVQKVELSREKIVMQDDRLQYSYQSYGDGIIAKLNLPSFYESNNASSCELDIREAILELKKQGKILGMVIDMRDNSGGFLNQAVKVAGLFITSGVVVISKYADGEMQYLRDVDGRIYYEGPLVLLTSKASASAAEIVAQSLQDYGTALVVGDERTYGKGSIQYQTVTDDDAKNFFKVTVGRYYTVSGRSTQIEGVKANILVPTDYYPYNIGERYLAYPLKNDQVAPAYVDPLVDIDQRHKPWFQTNYLPNIQKKLSIWTQMLPVLKSNSDYRISHNKNFSVFLKKQSPSTEGDLGNSSLLTADKMGVEDIQMAEAVQIIQDMISMRETKGLLQSKQK